MRFLVFVAALTLAACMPQAPQQQSPQGSATTTTQTAPPSKPGADVAVETTPILDREFLVGRWGDNGDCRQDVTLNADGSFTSYTGGAGQWSLNGGTMSMAGKQSTQQVQIEVIDQDHVRITNPDGSVGTSQRCT
jgi:hypothetical protein